jgi:hypothetical protein
MAWENIEQRLNIPFRMKITFPSGSVSLPETHLTIDDWLTSLAQSDEELRELNIPRIRFLQNRWLVEKLIQIRWERPSDRRSIWAMYVGRQAYVLFFDGAEYHVIAAIAPKDNPTLYRAVIGKLLENPHFVPERPTSIKSYYPDLISVEVDAVRRSDVRPEFEEENFGGLGGPVDWMLRDSEPGKRKSVLTWKHFLSEVFVGWIRRWLNPPEIGFWHDEMPDSVSRLGKGEIVMQYKPTYGDKQREAQRRRKEEQLRNRPLQKVISEESKKAEHRSDEKKRAA